MYLGLSEAIISNDQNCSIYTHLQIRHLVAETNLDDATYEALVRHHVDILGLPVSDQFGQKSASSSVVLVG